MRKHLHRSTISLAEGRMIYRVASGTPPRKASNPERVAIGVLTNAGLLDFDSTNSAEPNLSDDVRYSLMLDEHRSPKQCPLTIQRWSTRRPAQPVPSTPRPAPGTVAG